MKVSGDASVGAPIEKVYAALHDPAVLARSIPGCEQLSAVGADSYRLTVRAGVASIKGTYAGEVALSEHDPPAAFLLRASGAGAPGTVDAAVRISLAEEGEGRTRVAYDADAAVGGMIGGVGQRVLAGVAKKTAGEFFRNVDDALSGAAPPLPADAAAPARLAVGPARPAVEPLLAGRRPPGETRTLAVAAGVGAAIALAGVAVGAALGRRR